MKKNIITIFAGALLVCISFSGFSQIVSDEVAQAQIELARAIGRDENRAIFNNSLQLSNEEAENFWPVYEAYMAKMESVNDRLFSLVNEYAEYYNSATSENGTTNSLIITYLDIESDRLAIKQRDLENFSRVLPEEKVFLFFQIDNRIQNLVNLGLSSQIPLIIE